MPGAVILMLLHIRPAIFKSGKRIKRIDVSICLLCSCNFSNPFVRFLFHSFIRMVFQRIGDCLQGFVHITVIVINAFVLFVLMARHFFIIPDAAGGYFSLINHNWDSCSCNFFKLWFPKIISDGHLRKIHRIQFGNPGLCQCRKGYCCK